MKTSALLLILSAVAAFAIMFSSAGSSSLPTNIVLGLYTMISTIFLGLAGWRLRREKGTANLSFGVFFIAVMGLVVSAVLWFFHYPDSIGEGILVLAYSALTIITAFVCILVLFIMNAGVRRKE